MAVAIEAERNTVRDDHGVHSAEIAESIFGFELEGSGQDLAGGVVLKADQGKGGAAAFEPIVAAGIGERHHAETRAGRAPRAIFSRPALLRRSQFGSAQDAPHGLAADREVLFGTKFLRQMRIVEAQILSPGQAQDQLLLGNRNRPRHAASAIAMPHPVRGIWLVAAFQSMHLSLAQMQQAGG